MKVLQNNVELTPGQNIRGDNAIHPWAIIEHWTDEALQALGIIKVEEPEAPKEPEPEAPKVPPTPPPPTLEEVKAKALEEIDQRVFNHRNKVMSTGAIQSLVYVMKNEEARNYLANPTSDLSLYPMLAAALTAGEGATAQDIATAWADTYSQAKIALSYSEAARVKSTKLIDAATTPEEVQKVIEGFST